MTIPSVKNFQIIDRTDQDTIVLQFGKGVGILSVQVMAMCISCPYTAWPFLSRAVGPDRFHMDFREPLTCFQAFAVVLAQFNF